MKVSLIEFLNRRTQCIRLVASLYHKSVKQVYARHKRLIAVKDRQCVKLYSWCVALLSNTAVLFDTNV